HGQVDHGGGGEVASTLAARVPIRILAVFSEERLPGKLDDVPTAKEQGSDIQWPLVRGFYVLPKVADADYQWWVATFDKMLATPEFAKLREERGLFPFSLTGQALDAYVKKQVAEYRKLANEFEL